MITHDDTRGREPLISIQLWGSLPSDSTQITLSIDIHRYSNVWMSSGTAWPGCMPSWRDYHDIALGLGTILRTINCVYLQLPGGNPPLAELEALQSEKWCILYSMKAVVCAFSTGRHVGSRVGWLHSWHNLGTTLFALRCTWSER